MPVRSVVEVASVLLMLVAGLNALYFAGQGHPGDFVGMFILSGLMGMALLYVNSDPQDHYSGWR